MQKTFNEWWGKYYPTVSDQMATACEVHFAKKAAKAVWEAEIEKDPEDWGKLPVVFYPKKLEIRLVPDRRSGVLSAELRYDGEIVSSSDVSGTSLKQIMDSDGDY